MSGAGLIYWRIGLSTKKPWRSYIYFKTKRHYIAEMVVDFAIRQGEMLECFRDDADEVVEITKEEYFKHMWE